MSAEGEVGRFRVSSSLATAPDREEAGFEELEALLEQIPAHLEYEDPVTNNGVRASFAAGRADRLRATDRDRPQRVGGYRLA